MTEVGYVIGVWPSLAELGRVRRVLTSKLPLYPKRRWFVTAANVPNSLEIFPTPNLSRSGPRTSQRAFHIVSMAQYRTNDTPLRTTQRAPRSCRSCSSRKVKCDKAVPCSTCIKRGEADACVREVVIVRGEVITYVTGWITSIEITLHLHAP